MLGLAAGACGEKQPYTPDVVQIEVEVSPAKFIAVEKWDWTVDDPRNLTDEEKTKLRIQFGEQVIEWEGPEIPVVLREKDSVLFLVGYDREMEDRLKDHLPRYSYFRQDGNRMTRIRPEDFPKEIATQNMWLRDPKVLEAVLRLDTASTYFQMSSNAFIWEQLLTGKTKDVSVDQETLDEYVEKFKPIKLTAINREAVDGGHNLDRPKTE